MPRSPLSRAAAPATRRLPGHDERLLASMLIMRAGTLLTGAERELCARAVAPGAPPLQWRDKLRLAVLAGRLLGDVAP